MGSMTYLPQYRRARLVAALAFIVSIPAFAQTITGVVSGTVVDSTGSAVPGAAVTLTNTGTGAREAVPTTASGEFVFPSVQPATYSLIVEMRGLKRREKTQIVVTAGERVSAGTLKLEVGAISESVIVAADVTPVQTASDERSALLSSQQMNMLMARGRDYMSLLRTLPGVVPINDPASLHQQAA